MREMQMSHSPITPYLTVRGAAAAIDFYCRAFGAEERMRMPAPDGRRLMHAELGLNGGAIYLSDEFPEHGCSNAPEPSAQTPVAVSLSLGAAEDVDAVHARALEAGATSEMGPMDAFWGARYAIVEDPDGIAVGLMSPISAKHRAAPPQV
jgi:uncharacterized glyoxalase superfamily protein PhnB